MKVKSTKYPAQHYYGVCDVCDFTEGASHGGDIPRARSVIVEHVKLTGHKVFVEMAHTIVFEQV